MHAAVNHGVHVTGITLSGPQAERARARAEEAGVADRVDIRVQDWRELAGERFDAIASIGMVEHVGNVQIDAYAQRLRDLLEPDGRVLNHGIARVRHGDPEAGPFSERYVFPDAAPLHVGRVLSAFERAGLPADHIEGFQSDYAETLRHWAMRLDENLDRAHRAGRRGARARLAAVPARRAPGLRRRASPRSTRSARRRRASCSPPSAPRARRSAPRPRGALGARRHDS